MIGLSLQKMLILEPSKRISAKKAMQHPYFNDLDKSQLWFSSITKVRVKLGEGISSYSFEVNLIMSTYDVDIIGASRISRYFRFMRGVVCNRYLGTHNEDVWVGVTKLRDCHAYL